MNFRSSGELRYRSQVIIACMVTDLPEPVAPAMSMCGALPRLAKCAAPVIDLPRETKSGLSDLWNSSEPRMVAKPTVVFEVFGISMPTSDLPGIGASMRIGCAAKDRDRSLLRAVMRESLTPSAGFKA